MLTAANCNGKANLISFLTPESEVNVEAPVKFMARNDEILPIIRNHEIISITLAPKSLKYRSTEAISHPNNNPFKENRLKGIQGRKIGLSTQPAIYAPNKFVIARPPDINALSKE